MTADADDIQVTQSLTDVLGGIDRRLDQGFARLEMALDKKASKHDLDILSATVAKGFADLEDRDDDHEDRIVELETKDRGRVNGWRVVAGVIVALGALAGVAYTIDFIVQPH